MFGQTLIEQSDTDALILTDVPWAVAWRGKRQALWLPQEQTLLDEWLLKELAPDWIYLQGFPGISREEFAPWWGTMFESPQQAWFSFGANQSSNQAELIRKIIESE